MKVSFGLVAQFSGGAIDVGERVLDVALSGWGIDGLGEESELIGDGGIDLVEGVASAGAYVEDAASSYFAGSYAGEQVGADGVVDVVKVTAGEAVAEDGGSNACHHLEGELGNDAGVGRVSGLPGAEDVEVTEADTLQPVGAVEGLDVVLAGELLHSVGRERKRRHIFLFWLGGLVAVGGGGGRVDDAPNLSVAGCDEEVQRAVDVGFVGAEGVFDGARNRGERSLMEDVVDTLTGRFDASHVLQVHLLE